MPQTQLDFPRFGLDLWLRSRQCHVGFTARAARRANIPYMPLVLDEHSGQAGLITRLEAFVDMLVCRKEKM